MGGYKEGFVSRRCFRMGSKQRAQSEGTVVTTPSGKDTILNTTIQAWNMDENALSSQIIGAAIEVHRYLGPGLLENAYQAAMEFELGLRQIEFERQKEFPVIYKGHDLHLDYRVDLLVAGLVVVELKAVHKIEAMHEAQLLTYLKVSGCKLGLLLNFNVGLMRSGIRRVVYGLPEPVQDRPRIGLA